MSASYRRMVTWIQCCIDVTDMTLINHMVTILNSLEHIYYCHVVINYKDILAMWRLEIHVLGFLAKMTLIENCVCVPYTNIWIAIYDRECASKYMQLLSGTWFVIRITKLYSGMVKCMTLVHLWTTTLLLANKMVINIFRAGLNDPHLVNDILNAPSSLKTLNFHVLLNVICSSWSCWQKVNMIQIKALHWSGDKPLSEPVLAYITEACMHNPATMIQSTEHLHEIQTTLLNEHGGGSFKPRPFLRRV